MEWQLGEDRPLVVLWFCSLLVTFTDLFLTMVVLVHKDTRDHDSASVRGVHLLIARMVALLDYGECRTCGRQPTFYLADYAGRRVVVIFRVSMT